jgi:hypothetical protein
MDGEVTEYAVRNPDGKLEIRTSRRGEPYPAEQWARDHLALGSRVLRHRVVVVEDWTEMLPHASTMDGRT